MKYKTHKTITIRFDEYLETTCKIDSLRKAILSKEQAEQIRSVEGFADHVVLVNLPNDLFEVYTLEDYATNYAKIRAEKQVQQANRIIHNILSERKNALRFVMAEKGMADETIVSVFSMQPNKVVFSVFPNLPTTLPENITFEMALELVVKMEDKE